MSTTVGASRSPQEALGVFSDPVAQCGDVRPSTGRTALPWHQSRLCVFDTETTGKDPCEARIVTACVAYVGGGQPTTSRTWIVDPGIEIPEEASAIHGVTTEIARRDGIPPATAIAEIQSELVEAWAERISVVAFNASYDFTVLDREQRRNDLDESLAYGIGGAIIDPFVIDRHVDPYRRGPRTLTATCAHYAVRLDGAHDATADAIAAGRVAWAIGRRYKEIAEMSLRELHEAQIEWHAARQKDFKAYLERTGKDASDVSTEWPVRAYKGD